MNLYLIGYRGSGKSTVAPLLACRLGRNSIDTDLLIEEKSGKSISQIFADQGEAEFRRLESNAIAAYEGSANLIMSLGGGAPLAEINRNWIALNGKTVWLTASAEVLYLRIIGDPSSGTTRPNLTDQGGLLELSTILATRTAVYEDCADYAIDVAEKSPEQIAEAIVDWWNSVDKK